MSFITKIIYNLSICCYVFFIRVATLFNKKAKKWMTGRKNLMQGLAKRIPPQGVDVWIHCASLGEFEQGRPLIEALRKEDPDLFILLTFFSPSGYEIRKNYPEANAICYLPADTAQNAKKWIFLVRPKLTLFVKYEFWYHFISVLQKQNRPVLLVSGIFRKKQIFFKCYGRLFQNILKGYACLFVQDQKSATLLQQADIHNFSVVGDTRVDRVKQLSLSAKSFPEIAQFIDGQTCWIGGSTWPPDEVLLKSATNLIPKWIIAPHEIAESRLQEIEKLWENQCIRYSELVKNPGEGKSFQLLILDNIGMLSSVYKLGQVAYIGGGFGKGIHNILEAAVNRIPVIFGSNYQKFEEARALIERGGAFAVQNEEEFSQICSRLAQPVAREKAGEEAAGYIRENLGATKKIMEYIQEKRFLIKA